MRPTGTAEELERRRLRALGLLGQGKMPGEIAKLVGVDRRSVRRWKATIRTDGESGLRARPASGRPPKLLAKDKRKLERLLLKGPLAAGFGTDLWTCPRVAELIEQRFAVHYHVDHIGRLLHDLGWSPQKPTRRAIERDDEAIRRWVREDWERVKKTPAAAAPRSSSSTKAAS
jgi:transposase